MFIEIVLALVVTTLFICLSVSIAFIIVSIGERNSTASIMATLFTIISAFLLYLMAHKYESTVEYHPIVVVDRLHNNETIIFDECGTKDKLSLIASLISDDDIKSNIVIRYDITKTRLAGASTNISVTVKQEEK